MKNLLSITLVFSMFMLFSCGEATTTVKDGDKTEISKCGEEGHICSEACHAKNEDAHGEHDHAEEGHAHGEKVAHVCNADCKEGACNIKCGEEGHKCTDLCKAHTDTKEHNCSAKDAKCNTGTHKCGDHCGCGDGCGCTSEKSCSDNCKIKAA